MDKTFITIEEQIAQVLADISQKGFSSVQPFSIGKVETRMMQFAQVNAITLASDDLYMSVTRCQARCDERSITCPLDRLTSQAQRCQTLLRPKAK